MDSQSKGTKNLFDCRHSITKNIKVYLIVDIQSKGIIKFI